MARGYGQYCPFSLAVELLCQRWTLLVVSRLCLGCTRFNEIQQSLPRMSPTLLTRRLAELERAGLLETRRLPHRRGRDYLLTRAGRDLEPIIADLTVWGQRWARDLTHEDLDPAFLLWSMHLRVNTDAMPDGRTVLEFSFTGAPEDCSRFWLVCEDGSVEMCLKDPDLDVDVVVRSDLRRFVEVWRGLRDLRREIGAGHIEIHAPRELARQLPDWLGLHPMAGVERLKPGREQKVFEASR